jgi:DNA-binding XRE family transcriptional regulator
VTAVSTAISQAMTKRGLAVKDVAAQLHVTTGTVVGWRNGSNRPRIRYASAIADLLDWPSIATLVREAWTTPCLLCGRARVHGSNAGRYCGRRCQNTAGNRRRMDRQGKPGVLAQARLKVHEQAIDELCRKWCEPGGHCRDATCPIQAAGLSPLPLLKRWNVA